METTTEYQIQPELLGWLPSTSEECEYEKELLKKRQRELYYKRENYKKKTPEIELIKISDELIEIGMKISILDDNISKKPSIHPPKSPSIEYFQNKLLYDYTLDNKRFDEVFKILNRELDPKDPNLQQRSEDLAHLIVQTSLMKATRKSVLPRNYNRSIMLLVVERKIEKEILNCAEAFIDGLIYENDKKVFQISEESIFHGEIYEDSGQIIINKDVETWRKSPELFIMYDEKIEGALLREFPENSINKNLMTKVKDYIRKKVSKDNVDKRKEFFTKLATKVEEGSKIIDLYNEQNYDKNNPEMSYNTFRRHINSHKQFI